VFALQLTCVKKVLTIRDHCRGQADTAFNQISTEGVSVGERDFVRETMGRCGFRHEFWKVAIKPGKPVLFGSFDGKPCYGLPGTSPLPPLTTVLRCAIDSLVTKK